MSAGRAAHLLMKPQGKAVAEKVRVVVVVVLANVAGLEMEKGCVAVIRRERSGGQYPCP